MSSAWFVTNAPSLRDAEKRCRKCGRPKHLEFFPKDRGRPDGRWHTCRECNRRHWAIKGKRAAEYRRLTKLADKKSHSREGINGLRRYGQRPEESFGTLPLKLRPVARRLLEKYLSRHFHRMTPALYASLHATATSNARRVGDRSWARSMWRKKGYRRAERRKNQEEAELARIRRKNAGKSRKAYLPL